jgi:hypothetical protein
MPAPSRRHHREDATTEQAGMERVLEYLEKSKIVYFLEITIPMTPRQKSFVALDS